MQSTPYLSTVCGIDQFSEPDSDPDSEPDCEPHFEPDSEPETAMLGQMSVTTHTPVSTVTEFPEAERSTLEKSLDWDMYSPQQHVSDQSPCASAVDLDQSNHSVVDQSDDEQSIGEFGQAELHEEAILSHLRYEISALGKTISTDPTSQETAYRIGCLRSQMSVLRNTAMTSLEPASLKHLSTCLRHLESRLEKSCEKNSEKKSSNSSTTPKDDLLDDLEWSLRDIASSTIDASSLSQLDCLILRHSERIKSLKEATEALQIAAIRRIRRQELIAIKRRIMSLSPVLEQYQNKLELAFLKNPTLIVIMSQASSTINYKNNEDEILLVKELCESICDKLARLDFTPRPDNSDDYPIRLVSTQSLNTLAKIKLGMINEASLVSSEPRSSSEETKLSSIHLVNLCGISSNLDGCRRSLESCRHNLDLDNFTQDNHTEKSRTTCDVFTCSLWWFTLVVIVLLTTWLWLVSLAGKGYQGRSASWNILQHSWSHKGIPPV